MNNKAKHMARNAEIDAELEARDKKEIEAHMARNAEIDVEIEARDKKEIETSEAEAVETFVAITTIAVGTGNIFLAEGQTEDEARTNGLDAILPENMWIYASIYDTTKRKNLRIIKLGKARQLGYTGQKPAYDDMVDDEDFGAY